MCLVSELDEDSGRQVSPAEVKAKLPWMVKYFSKGQNWYFIDAQGEPQGPFPPENMSNWFKVSAPAHTRGRVCVDSSRYLRCTL